MLRLLAIFLAAILASATAVAQAPKVELFGGYSFLHSPGQNFNGWNGAGTVYVNQWLGVTADLSGHYWTHQLNVPGVGSLTFKTHQYTYAIGPTLALHNRTRFTPFLHTLAGATRYSFPSYGIAGVNVPASTHFAFLGGGGLDISLGERVAVRPVQLEYHGAHFAYGWLNSMRYSTGIVFRFGGS